MPFLWNVSALFMCEAFRVEGWTRPSVKDSPDVDVYAVPNSYWFCLAYFAIHLLEFTPPMKAAATLKRYVGYTIMPLYHFHRFRFQ